MKGESAEGIVIITEDVHDPDGMAAYAKAAGPTLAAHGARVLVADPSGVTLEGSWHGNQTVVVEFESTEAARRWYESEQYQAAKALREEAAISHAVLLSGFSPRPSSD